jgi:hypothetical protein
LPVDLYEFETWSVTLREEHRLRVFENRVLRGIFGSKGDEVIGGWRKLHNEELHNLYCSSNIIKMIKSRRMRLVGHVARMVGEPEGKRPLRRPTYRLEDNIKTERREIKWGVMDCLRIWISGGLL